MACNKVKTSWKNLKNKREVEGGYVAVNEFPLANTDII